MFCYVCRVAVFTSLNKTQGSGNHFMSDQNQSKDTGRDCPYCGGVIYRVENESGKVKTAFHNCKICGARWSDNWSLTSPGNRGSANNPGRKSRRVSNSSSFPSFPSFNWQSMTIPIWGWILIVILLAFLLIQLRLVALIRILIFPVTLIVLGYFVFRIGRDQRWW